MTWTRLPLARAAVDRGAERRAEPTLVSVLLADPRTRVLLVRHGAVAMRGGVALNLLGPRELGEHTADLGRWLYLGTEDGVGYLAAVIRDDADARSSDWATLRDVGAALSDRDAGLATMAVGLAAWHRSLVHCPHCGAELVVEDSGWLLRCPVDASPHYPRTDPAVIMAVLDASDRLLLARASRWSQRRFSTVAGFVEPGESAEQAVRREVAEETGVIVGEVTYLGSQPWPFPGSLMLAFRAAAVTTPITVDGVELTEARWFSRAELAADIQAGLVAMPSRASIARVMIEDWFGGALPGE